MTSFNPFRILPRFVFVCYHCQAVEFRRSLSWVYAAERMRLRGWAVGKLECVCPECIKKGGVK